MRLDIGIAILLKVFNTSIVFLVLICINVHFRLESWPSELSLLVLTDVLHVEQRCEHMINLTNFW